MGCRVSQAPPRLSVVMCTMGINLNNGVVMDGEVTKCMHGSAHVAFLLPWEKDRHLWYLLSTGTFPEAASGGRD